MSLREKILKEHSKAQCDRIVKWVGGRQERFDALFHLFLHDEYRVVQRSAWPLSHCVITHPAFLSEHWAGFIKNLRKPNLHNAVKRNSLRLLQDIEIPEKYHGEVMHTCFTWLESPTEALAVKVFSMSVLGKLAAEYPGIIPELKLVIKEQIPVQSAGFKSRAKKVLKQIDNV